jgi:septal ring factor EnvC (AmiA/AmiB activator)
VWALLAAAVLACSVPSATLAADPEATEADLGRIRKEIADLQREIRRDTSRRDALAARLRDAEMTVAGARRKLGELRAAREASERRRDQLQQEKAASEKVLETERAALAAQVRAAFTIGREEQLKLLLNQQDPERVGRMFVYYGYFGRARAARIEKIGAEIERLAALEVQLQEETERLAALESDARDELRAMQTGRRDRSRVLSELEAKLRGRTTSLAKLKREETTLEKLLADLRRLLSDFPVTSGEPFEKLRGKLSAPVRGKLVGDFGQRRSGNVTWNGVLLATERGSEVRAVYFGRVIYADWLPGMGLLTILEHSGGYLSLYGHNEQLFKSVGDWVAPGDVIATVGDSGGRSRPELYFEIRKGSKPLNPHQWIRKGQLRR